MMAKRKKKISIMKQISVHITAKPEEVVVYVSFRPDLLVEIHLDHVFLNSLGVRAQAYQKDVRSINV